MVGDEDFDPEEWGHVGPSLSYSEGSPELWEALYDEAVAGFDRGLEWNLELREKSTDMVKVVLLLGSFYVAAFRFGGESFGLRAAGPLAWFPFVCLLFALLLFVYSYQRSRPAVLGPQGQHPKIAIQDDLDDNDYRRAMTVVYYGWSRENNDNRRNASRAIAIGIGTMFASLGAFAVILTVL